MKTLEVHSFHQLLEAVVSDVRKYPASVTFSGKRRENDSIFEEIGYTLQVDQNQRRIFIDLRDLEKVKAHPDHQRYLRGMRTPGKYKATVEMMKTGVSLTALAKVLQTGCPDGIEAACAAYLARPPATV